MQVIVNQLVVCQYVHTEPFLKTSLIGVPLAIVLPDVKKPSYPLFAFVQLQGKRPGDAMLEFTVTSDNGKTELHKHSQKLSVTDQDPRIKAGEMFSVIHARPIGAVTFKQAGWFSFNVAIDGEIKRKLKLQVIEQKVR